MKYTVKEAISLLQAIINDEPRLDEWNSLVSCRHRDPFTETLARDLSYIEDNYSASHQGRFLDDQGLEQLAMLIARLRNDGDRSI